VPSNNTCRSWTTVAAGPADAEVAESSGGVCLCDSARETLTSSFLSGSVLSLAEQECAGAKGRLCFSSWAPW
jgi:hypothetical protein